MFIGWASSVWFCYALKVKAKTFKDVLHLKDIPNIGPAMVEDFKILGITEPKHLKRKNGLRLYKQLCKKTGVRHDPCVLDTFLAAVDFMNGAPAKPWWKYTENRKKQKLL